MLADLPPSSWATLLTVGADAIATATPALVEPVKCIISMSLCSDRAAPTIGPIPLTRLKTPAGTFAASNISANIIPQNGVISLGFNTIVHPDAIAEATFVHI